MVGTGGRRTVIGEKAGAGGGGHGDKGCGGGGGGRGWGLLRGLEVVLEMGGVWVRDGGWRVVGGHGRGGGCRDSGWVVGGE